MSKPRRRYSGRRRSPSPHRGRVEKGRGIIRVHPRGFGFVKLETASPSDSDIFIPMPLKADAIDSDFVEISFDPKSRQSPKGPEGRVLKVITRHKRDFVAIVWKGNPTSGYQLYLPSMRKEKSGLLRPLPGKTYRLGDRLFVRAVEWKQDQPIVVCTPLQELGPIDDPSRDIEATLLDMNLPSDFPQAVKDEVAQLPKRVVRTQWGKDRVDLTHLTCITIDPNSAKDFDDALSLHQDQQGHYHLGVHIADVAHYIRPDSPLDREAKRRGNSTYLPNFCLPMLPEQLSNNLCSLIENRQRLTVSVMMEFNAKGELLDYQLKRSCIRSRKRLTYGQARKILAGTLKSPYGTLIQEMEQLCRLLKAKRSRRGSVDLALPSLELQIDAHGAPYDYRVEPYDSSHQIVEEFMLKANEVVAKHCCEQGLPSIFRIHDAPLDQSLETFYALARSLGFSLPASPTIKEVQELFDYAKNSPHIHQVAIGFIRSMQLAVYSHENVGHYGLALDHYCHFTSPIRRYSDLIIHRAIFEQVEQPDIEQLAANCSETARTSLQAEISVLKFKKLRLLRTLNQKNPDHLYEAFVTKVIPKGLFFEIHPLYIEGFVPISTLPGTFRFHPKDLTLTSSDTQLGFFVGKSIEVALEEVDLIVGEGRWKLALPTTSC